MYEKKEEDGTILLTGYKLKFYYEEQEEFSESYHKKISIEQARKIMTYAQRTFNGLQNIQLQFKKLPGRVGGRFQITRRTIIIDTNNINIGIISHEIAHAIDHSERGKTTHDKYLFNIVRMVNEKIMNEITYYEESIPTIALTQSPSSQNQDSPTSS